MRRGAQDAAPPSVCGVPDAASELQRDWTFTPGEPPGWITGARLRIALRRSVRFPRHAVLKSPGVRGRKPWAVYFVFAPDRRLNERHLFCLDALRAQGFDRLVVVAGMDERQARGTLDSHAECLIWKASAGFDFSAYSIGLWWLARHAPGCDVLVLNDSVFGPFGDVAQRVATAPWRVTGFTGSGYWGNHIQSYAFMIRDLTPGLLWRLALVFNTVRAFDQFDHVVLVQELSLARTAARCTTVGALWYAPTYDPVTVFPRDLLAQGFPFIKRSLLDKHAARQPDGVIRAELLARGFKLDTSAAAAS